MKAIDLYRFTENNKIEWHWYGNEIIYCVEFYLLRDFAALIGYEILSDGDISCTMKSGYVVFEMSYICDYFDIKLTEVFEKEKV